MMPRRLWRPLLVVLGVSLALIAVAIHALFSGLPDPSHLDKRVPAPSILIEDRNGRLLYEVVDPASNKHTPVALSEVPAACIQATIATEDARFFSHPGVDPLSILRAALQNTRAGVTVSGGSTLTQQLARNLLLSETERTERSLRRKLREAFLAWRIERTHSKNAILALYLNTTYYGHHATGIEAAAEAYFGSPARDLDLAQCALLAGLPQYPAGYNPIENPEAATGRQRVVLDLMVAHGSLSAGEAGLARRERLSFASTPFPIEAPHFVMWVQNELESQLPAPLLRAGGLRVVTTLDLNRQWAAERAVQHRLTQLRPCASLPHVAAEVACDPTADASRRIENAALVALDPRSGEVLALVGSPDYFERAISGALNAALAPRQPGSAIKPFVYALALNPARARAQGGEAWTAATVVPDIRSVFADAQGRPYVPNNYDRKYHGPVSVRAALANSYNIPAVRTLDRVGVDQLVDLAAQLGIRWDREQHFTGAEPDNLTPEPGAASLASERFGLSLALGGGEVRLLDLTAAYAALANGGERVSPRIISRVERLDGTPVEYATARSEATEEAKPVIDPRVAFLLTDILSDRNARLPAFGPGNLLEIGRPAAAKTGTTSDWRDNWAVGYTAELVAGVWVGNADNTPMKDVSGITGAAPIWHDFMVAALAGVEPSSFAVPDGLRQVEVCADSGLLPGGPSSGWQGSLVLNIGTTKIIPCDARRLEWFLSGTEPVTVDRQHVVALIDARNGAIATDWTPAAARQPEQVWLMPPTYHSWARAAGIPYELPVGSGAPGGVASQQTGAPVRLLSPDPNRHYRIDPLLPRSAQSLPLTAEVAGGDDSYVTFIIDGHVVASAGGPEFTAWWQLEPGKHTVCAETTTADGSRIKSSEVVVLVD